MFGVDFDVLEFIVGYPRAEKNSVILLHCRRKSSSSETCGIEYLPQDGMRETTEDYPLIDQRKRGGVFTTGG